MRISCQGRCHRLSWWCLPTRPPRSAHSCPQAPTHLQQGWLRDQEPRHLAQRPLHIPLLQVQPAGLCLVWPPAVGPRRQQQAHRLPPLAPQQHLAHPAAFAAAVARWRLAARLARPSVLPRVRCTSCACPPAASSFLRHACSVTRHTSTPVCGHAARAEALQAKVVDEPRGGQALCRCSHRLSAGSLDVAQDQVKPGSRHAEARRHGHQ